MRTNNIINFLITWEIAYVGIVKDWLSPKETLQNIKNDCFNELSDELIAELYTNEENRQKFIEVLDKFVNLSKLEFDEILQIWMKFFLNNVYLTNKSVKEKLLEIAQLWAMFDYPIEWRSFIYYMPSSEPEEFGEKFLYQRFQQYLFSLLNRGS